MGTAVSLRTVLGNYPHTEPLKSGKISNPDVALDFRKVEPIHRAFAPMARTQAYDVSEMAIVTCLQAKAYNKPIILLPAVVASRFQQGCIIYNSRRGHLTTADLHGARVGVRAYTQTTGMWVRGILAETYGVAPNRVTWVTIEGSHLAEYKDPSFVRRAEADQKLVPMLRAGEIDAAILGNDLPHEAGLDPLIPDAVAADRAWFGHYGFVPINHMVVMSEAAARRNPHCVAAVYDLLKRGKAMAGQAKDLPDRLPMGVSALRGPLQVTLDFCERQQLLPRKLTVDEIFADSIEFLGDLAE